MWRRLIGLLFVFAAIGEAEKQAAQIAIFRNADPLAYRRREAEGGQVPRNEHLRGL